MLTFDQYWNELPSSIPMWKIWERRIDTYRIDQFPDYKRLRGFGPLNGRLNPQSFFSSFRWDFMNFNSFLYFQRHPVPTQDLILTNYLDSGLEFYVYLLVDTIHTDYNTIKQQDYFYLGVPGACLGFSLRIPCEIIDPPNEQYKLHQVVHTSTASNCECLALPVFLRIPPESLLSIKEVFDSSNISNLTFSLFHRYPETIRYEFQEAEGKTYITGYGGASYPEGYPLGNYFENFFTIFRNFPEQIRILVASDIHVADRWDTIEANIAQSPPNGNFCNCNKQAEKLAKKIINHWRSGEIDYAVLNGDLVDFVLKDSLDLKVYVAGVREVATNPKFFGMGEKGYNISNLIDHDSPGNRFFRAVPDGPENVERLKNIVENTLQDFDSTNWSLFETIFKNTFSCVRTFLLPGNHDYIPFGYDFIGLTEEQWEIFFRGVAGEVIEEDVMGSLIRLYLLLHFIPREAANNMVIALGGGLPEYQDTSNFVSSGLDEVQAKRYDDEFRKLVSNLRPLLGGLWDKAALTGMYRLTGDRRIATSSHVIPYVGGELRLGFMDSGPNWNMFYNASPWVRGFDWDKKPNDDDAFSAISQFTAWRDGSDHSHALIVFMHAPPITTKYAYTGPTQPYAFSDFTVTFISDIPTLDLGNLQDFFDTLALQPLVKSYMWMPFSDLHEDSPPTNYDFIYGAPYHHHRDLMNLISPVVDSIERQFPILVFAGHTHWKHNYSITSIKDNAAHYADLHFQYGPGLLDELRNSVPEDWWRQRAMVITSGCLGPIPPPEYKTYTERVTPEDPGYVDPIQSQGYYIVTVKNGVVYNVEWYTLSYMDPDETP